MIKQIDKMIQINLETERLLIEPLKLDDGDFMFKLLNTEGWIKFISNRNIKTKEDATAYIQKILHDVNYTYLVFSLKETNSPIGLVTLIKRDFLDYCDIGFAILPEYENSGYSLEATCKFLLEIEKSKLYTKIVAITVPENVSSISLLKKMDFIYEKKILKGEEVLSVYNKIL
jgi:ribosomal-protein-alanine N-acetyltransferase